MNPSALSLDIRDDAIAVVTLNRPDKRNAFDDSLIAEMIAAFQQCESNQQVKVVLLRAVGSHFSAGADLGWMKRMAQLDYEANLADAQELARLMSTLDRLSKPTVVRVQGAAFGGALGLIACCDIAIAADNAQFCLSEVKLGLAPAVISPYVVRAMGVRASRRYFLTAEVFDASTAARLDLVHQVVPLESLDETVEATLAQLRRNGPAAMAASKKLIARAADQPLDEALIQKTAEAIATLRVSAEGQEGLTAFFEKRAAHWSS